MIEKGYMYIYIGIVGFVGLRVHNRETIWKLVELIILAMSHENILSLDVFNLQWSSPN